jgi:phospholipase C
MRRFTLILYSQITWIMALFLLLPNGVQAWDSAEHPVLGDYAIATLGNDGFNYISDGMRASDQHGTSLQQLFEQGEHDADLNYLSKSHYYDPFNGHGLWGYRSALQDCIGRYSDAIAHWKAGDIAEAVYQLGQAAHLVQDVAVPFHTHLDPLNGHSVYEMWALGREGDFFTTSGGNYSLSSPSDYIEQTALISFGYYDSVMIANASDAKYTAAVNVLEPLAIRMTAGLVHLFFSEVEWQRPVLSASGGGTGSESLFWTPSAEPNFVRYDVYMTSAGKELIRDEAHKVLTIADRSANTADLTGLTSNGQYQFQVVTVLSNESLVSDALTLKLGAPQYLEIAVIAGIGTLGVAIAIVYVLRSRDQRRKMQE